MSFNHTNSFTTSLLGISGSLDISIIYISDSYKQLHHKELGISDSLDISIGYVIQSYKQLHHKFIGYIRLIRYII